MKIRMPSAAAGAANTPRLLPALIVTLGVVLSLKAVAAAEAANTATQTTQPTPAPPPAAPSAATPAAQPQESAVPGGQSCPSNLAAAAGLSPAEVQVLQSLGERRKQLEAREAELGAKAELATAAEKRLSERLDELKKLEARVQALLGQVDDEQSRRLASLVDVYQRMRAKDAAAVFDELDEAVLVQVAARMRQQNLAEIMARMNPVRARSLTIKLAETRLPPAPPSTSQPKTQPR